MDELVLPAVRNNLTFRLVGCTVFVTIGASLVIAGLAAILQHRPDADGMLLLAGMGALVVLMFGRVLLDVVLSLCSPGLRLSINGLDYNGFRFGWADIEAFHAAVGGASGVTHVRLQFSRDAPLPRSAKVSVALGKVGFFTAPAHIPVGAFDAGSRQLINVLQEWWNYYHDPAIEVHPFEADAWRNLDADLNFLALGHEIRPELCDAPDADELILPVRRGQAAANAAGPVLVFVVLLLTFPLVLLDRSPGTPTSLTVGLAVLLLFLAGWTGHAAYRRVRILLRPGLRLHSKGFEFGRDRWAWADVESVHAVEVPLLLGGTATRLRVKFRPGHQPQRMPSDIDFGLFDTGSTGLAVILRQWLRRYGTP